MSRTLFDDIKHFFIYGNMINKLILVNIFIGVVFIILKLLIGGGIYGLVIEKYVLLSGNFVWDILHPWVFLTYMFLSGSLIHFVFNMLFLYWFGNIIGDFVGDKKILALYVIGGLTGAIIFLIGGYLFFPGNLFFLYGIDAIIISFAVAAGVLVPDLALRLILIGEVRLKYIVIVFVLIEFLYAFSNYYPVYYAYAGSAIFGWYYIYSMRKGKDISVIFNNTINKFSHILSIGKIKQKQKLSVKYKSETKKERRKTDDIEFKNELDRILEKIKEKGYDNLSDKEKEFLFIASKRE